MLREPRECGYLGVLPTAPGNVDVQTLFREKDQFIISLALYEVRDETTYSPLTRCPTLVAHLCCTPVARKISHC